MNAHIGRLILVAIALLLVACSSNEAVPKPRGFHRLFFPAHAYQAFDCPLCPFTFEHPTYGRLVQLRPDSCVFDLVFDSLGCRWHTTVEILSPNYGFAQAFEKYRSLIYRHSSKARIYEVNSSNANGTGRFFELYGEVPTSAQFLFSDSTRYTIETSFYFETAQQNDSLAPVIEFIKQDLHHMLQSIRWKPNWQRPSAAFRCADSTTTYPLRTTTAIHDNL
jgi:gliding motility-associated lipoprotein GldD